MKHPIALILLLFFFAACQQEAELPVTPQEGEGTLILSLGGAGLYTELQTRAEQPVADLSKYEFSISGTTISGAPVSNLEVTVDDQGLAKVAAGTYTLSANNRTYASLGNGRPYYAGTSEPFTIAINETLPVTIALGKPRNACIRVAYDATFTALYKDAVVTLADNERSVTLWTEEDACYFVVPASGALAYTITATAKANTQVSDMTATGYVEIQEGCYTTITLKVHPMPTP